MNLGGGVAFRDRLARPRPHSRRSRRGLHGLLSAQDGGGWRPHITIQNKVQPKVASALMAEMRTDFAPRAARHLPASGFTAISDGPWERIALYPFRGS